MKDFLKNHFLWIAWGLFIIALVSIPGKDLPELSEDLDTLQPDKLVHVLLFLVFVVLLQRGFDHPFSSSAVSARFYLLTVSSGILLGGMTEMYQHFFIPGRNATLKDFLFNTLGCVIGYVLYPYLREKRQV